MTQNSFVLKVNNESHLLHTINYQRGYLPGALLLFISLFLPLKSTGQSISENAILVGLIKSLKTDERKKT